MVLISSAKASLPLFTPLPSTLIRNSKPRTIAYEKSLVRAAGSYIISQIGRHLYTAKKIGYNRTELPHDAMMGQLPQNCADPPKLLNLTYASVSMRQGRLEMASLSLTELAHRFADPPRDFSPVPIWWWSGDRLERDRLRDQLERFAQGGVYNLIVLNLAPTGPLYGSDPDEPPFLSDAWWAIFEGVCEDARALGMRLWFYDQLGFSGANLQGDLVRQEPRFAGQWLESVTQEGEGALEVICPPEGEPLAATTTPIDGRGQPIGEPIPLSLDGRRARYHGQGRWRIRLVYALRRGFDYFDPQACRRLLDVVHGAFERRLGRFFGNVIVGSFQDELPSMPTWGKAFAAEFQKRKGYDLRPYLGALWDGVGERFDRVRVDYHQMRAELAEEAFFRPLFDWHERHGLICGFDQQGPARAGEPIATVRLYADYLRTHRWYGAPGSDHHGEAKIHSSLAHLYSRPRTWIEAFHSSGWGGTLEETFDWLLPWLRAGANLYNPHAVYYSTRGGWWEWAPPSTCWRQPYWRHYPHFAQVISRLCFLLSQGAHVCDIGVLHPTTAVQAGLTPDGPLPAAQAAHEAYLALIGRMTWFQMEPGVLDRDRRDFDVLDEPSVQRAEVRDGALQIGEERYRAIVLPACATVESATAEVLCRFVAAGGWLIAVGEKPRQVANGDDRPLRMLQQLFAEGQARHVERPEEVPQALADLPRRVEAPVPALHRRIGGRDILFVPAAFPMATRHQPMGRWWEGVSYTFDPDRYQRSMRVFLRGASRGPQLWDPLTGERRALAATVREDGVEVEIPFDHGPAALLVWPDAGDEEAELPPITRSVTRRELFTLSGPWEVQLEPTLDNRFGDFAKPEHPGAPPVQTWHLQHRLEGPGEDGLLAGWHRLGYGEGWQDVQTTYGIYGWWVGPRPADELPGPLPGLAVGDDPLATSGWQPAIYSLTRGIWKDPLHPFTLGPKGHVPEEFLHFGQVKAGEGVQFRTAVWMPEAQTVHLALGAPAAKRAWANGHSLGEGGPGYLWLIPIHLQKGMNLLEWQLIAEDDLILRAYWALVRHPERFARPEWIQASDAPRKGSTLRFSCTLSLPFAPMGATIQVGAEAPCRILVNGEEIGRQGGFDPYESTARVQPYAVKSFHLGANEVAVEMQDQGRPAALLVDARVDGPGGSSITLISGADWQVQRDGGAPMPVQLRRRQWLDPAWSHLWRRPHPLPGAAWIEDTPADDTVWPVVPDAFGGRSRVEWFRWVLPPGAVEMELPVAGQARLWVNGEEVTIADGRALLPGPEAIRRTAVLRVLPERGRSGGGVFTGPITYTLGPGRMELGAWGEQGLEAYSGGIRYRTAFSLDAVPMGPVELDLGRVRGTAEVWINGQPMGSCIWSPYRVDISGAVQVGENTVEVLVLNTLGPYLRAVSPTHFVLPGQEISGLFGPVRVLAREEEDITKPVGVGM